MKRNSSFKQIAAIVACQSLAVGLMVLGASALAQFPEGDDATPAAMLAETISEDCPDTTENSSSRGTNEGFLDLSVGWLRR